MSYVAKLGFLVSEICDNFRRIQNDKFVLILSDQRLWFIWRCHQASSTNKFRLSFVCDLIIRLWFNHSSVI